MLQRILTFDRVTPMRARSSALQLYGFLLSMLWSTIAVGQTVPRPDHVVICVLENHGYWSIVGSPYAPFINGLIGRSALLEEYYALTHPSQPNYIMLYSGDNQGVTDDYLPAGTPWSAPNLGASLLQHGFTFTGYSEGLPSTGALDEVSGGYYRKHAPWVNWQGTGSNQLPVNCNQPFSAFPVDYHFLPDVAFVIPTVANDMHDGTDPVRIQVGDTWVRDHLEAYVDWADQNNSLFILVFDEDDDLSQNHILCLFHGPMVQQGVYGLNGYHHYDLLKTLIDMYDLPDMGATASAESILEIWNQSTHLSGPGQTASTYWISPNPMALHSPWVFSSSTLFSAGSRLLIHDMQGRTCLDLPLPVNESRLVVPADALPTNAGVYSWQVLGKAGEHSAGRFVRE